MISALWEMSMQYKTGDHVWVQAGYIKPREAIIRKLYDQSADVYFIRTMTNCVVPLSTLIPVPIFAIMGDGNDDL